MDSLPPFALIVPGRPPTYTFTQTAANQWVTALDGIPSTFLFYLTLSQPLPDGHGVSIYGCSSAAGSSDYALLGAVTAAKPSCLVEVPAALLPGAVAAPAASLTIGISLETEDTIRSTLDDGSAGGSSAPFPSGVPFGTQQLGGATPAGATVAPGGSAVYKANDATRYAISEGVLEEFCTFVGSFVKTVNPATASTVFNDVMGSSDSVQEWVIMPANFVSQWQQRMQRKMRRSAGAS